VSDGKKRYVQVGIGGRSQMCIGALTGEYRQFAELAAICDVNPGRLELQNRKFRDRGLPELPAYPAADFDRMIAEQKPDAVIVTTGPDVTHSDYIVRSLELGCDVVTEKPMTTDEVRCRRILATAARTGRKVQVSFNYRYAPHRTQVKEMLAGGAIGEVLSVDFAWLLDTRHGADYFRRWHRRRENSGSLLVHKATHHFDLVNWWLSDVPEEVFARGSLRYYAPATAERMGLAGRGERCLDCPVSGECRFFLDLSAHEGLKEMYLDNERHDGYFRDRCVFSEAIDIWDSMSLVVRYGRGALMSYMLHAYSPYEGYRVAFNGTRGRLEHVAGESTYVSGDGSVPGEVAKRGVSITLIPEFAAPRAVEVHTSKGGHGGGDPGLLADLFDPSAPPDRLGRRASQRDGAYSILTGVAAARSIDTGGPVKIADLLADAPLGD
jgi:predicted dehydrogenase